MDDLAIGIDLGTTNSCVALYIDGKTKILENSEGGRVTPSFIFFTSLDETVVGEYAKQIAEGKPDHGVYEVKRLVGRSFTSPYLQNNLKYLPFKVKANISNGDSLILIDQTNKILMKSPQQLCSIILQKLKKDVEAKLGLVVDKVVITVPAYFSVRQREVTLAASRDAGFTVLKLLNEPTAAALSYYFENSCVDENYSLVFDLGGGTFDVAILKRTLNNIEIVSVDGDTHFGGHDLDNILVNHVCDILIRDYGCDPKSDKDNLRRLHNMCENAKKLLSFVQETAIILIGFVAEYPKIQIVLTRETFESITKELFQKTMDIVANCIKTSGISKSSIKEVILSGGSTRIPKIQEMLSDFFDGKALNKFVNPDECVAEGAALQAAMLSKNEKQKIRKIRLTDVVPLSLGKGTYCDEMRVLIKRNSPIPASSSRTITNLKSKQSAMSFRVYEGERTDVKKNRFLGKMTITNLTPAPPHQCEVIFTMNIDENGILTVKAEEKNRDNVKELKVAYTRGNQSEKKVKKVLLDAEQNKEEDSRFKKFTRMKAYLRKYCLYAMDNLEQKDLIETHNEMFALCQKTEKEVKYMNLQEEKILKELVAEVETKCNPIAQYYNFALMPSPPPKNWC